MSVLPQTVDLPEFSLGERLEFSFDLVRASLAVTIMFWILLSAQWIGIPVPLVRQVVGFVFLTILPGALFLTLLGITPQLEARWLVYVVGTSLALLMALGLAIFILLTTLGFVRPFSLEIFSVGVTALVLAFLLALNRYETPSLEGSVRLNPSTLLFLQIPLWSILAINFLNGTGANRPLIILLLVLSILPILTVIGVFSTKVLPLGVWTLALAVLFHKSLWSLYVYHGHASAIGIWNTGIWDPASENLLSLAVIPPMYAYLLDVTILTQLKVVNPVIIAFIPLGMYAAFRSYVTPLRSFLGASLFIFAHPFYFQYPSEPRVGLPVLFLVLLGVVVSDFDLTQSQQRVLSLLFGAGIVVSHYGTSYYVMFAVVGSGVLLYAYSMLDGIISYRTNRSTSGLLDSVWDRMRQIQFNTLTWSFGGFYVVTTITWYLYTKQARTFESLIIHIFNAVESLFINTSSLGSTATRLQTDYGGISIALSKYLYMLFGLLLGLGLFVTHYRRFFRPDQVEFNDEFLALSSFLFVLFGGSMVFSGEWGGGRPMMIVFSFSSIFIVIGAAFFSGFVRRLMGRILALIGSDIPTKFPPRSNVPLGVFLSIFLILNTGVVAASVSGGRAPSNVPLQSEFSESENPNLQTLLFVRSDTELHVWLATHMSSENELYGDRIARAQATDWYVGRILSETGPLNASYRFTKSNHLHFIEGGEVEPGYVMLLGHNVVHGTIALNYITWGQLEEYDVELDSRSQIYSNGQGLIYYHGNETRTTGGT